MRGNRNLTSFNPRLCPLLCDCWARRKKTVPCVTFDTAFLSAQRPSTSSSLPSSSLWADSRPAGYRLRNGHLAEFGTTLWPVPKVNEALLWTAEQRHFLLPSWVFHTVPAPVLQIEFWPWCIPAYRTLPLFLTHTKSHTHTYHKLFSAVVLDQCYTHTFVQLPMHVGCYEKSVFVSVVYVVPAFIFAAACIGAACCMVM